ncbi:HAD family hydrolase [Pseudomonas soli]|uniref:5'-deoxynucleotidase n=1 Tax=Pseudomonas soli TaxID=1306993 RepID=A0A2V4J4B5_9PSED|nr:HAD family hydrolase [Pseudomonas soli]
MNIEKLQNRLDFLRQAEQLKSVLRSAHTSTGRAESTAEHTWRLCLMAITFADELGDLDLLKVLKMCLVHDLGEAISGDVPAVSKHGFPDKSQQERDDLLQLMASLDTPLREEIMGLWEDYEAATSAEAQAVKALDKLETLLQHNQGRNPPGFDYAFNLDYGKRYTAATPLFEALRGLIDADTRRHLDNGIALRDERPEDIDAIGQLTEAAFADAEHSSHTEQFIVTALRRAGQLTVSLVAVEASTVVGHVAISPVTLASGASGWFGLGPVSVSPARQGQGIGSALINAALARLHGLGGQGCVVLGDPRYYARFGFKAQPGLTLPGVPAEYFQALAFAGGVPQGDVQYHAAFEATSNA